MLKKQQFLLSIFMILLFCTPVYASSMKTKNIYVGEDDYITISSMGGTWKVGYRCLPEFQFTITESKQGLLQEGKTIYFSTDPSFLIDGAIRTVCENGDVYIESETIQKPEENVFAFHIKQVVNKKKLPLTIHYSAYPYISLETAEKKGSEQFPLYLLTGNEYADNLFATEEEEPILLNKKFLMLVQKEKTEPIERNDLTRYIEIPIGQNYLLYDGKQIPLAEPAYVDENGIVMLPLREVAENLGASVHVEYDAEKRAAVVQIFSTEIILPIEGMQYYIHNATFSYSTPPVVQNGKVFLSAEDIAMALYIPKAAVKWDAEAQVITFNEEKPAS